MGARPAERRGKGLPAGVPRSEARTGVGACFLTSLGALAGPSVSLDWKTRGGLKGEGRI